jgi:hypothetical protein
MAAMSSSIGFTGERERGKEKVRERERERVREREKRGCWLLSKHDRHD